MLNHLAILEARKGNFAEAEKLRLRALDACRKTKEPGRSPLVSTLLQLASFYHKSNKQEKAVQYYREAIAAGKGIKMDGVHYVRMALVNLGNLLALKNREEAIKVKNEALASASSKWKSSSRRQFPCLPRRPVPQSSRFRKRRQTVR